MSKRTIFLMRASIIGFIMVLIPYIENAASGPSSSSGINVFLGYYTANTFSSAYILIITIGMIRGVILTLFVISLLNDLGQSEPTKFDLNK